MSSEENKALYRRFLEEVFGKKNPGVIDQFIAPNCVDHAAPPGFPKGVEGAKQMLGMYLAAFPDVNVSIEDMIAEGDRVVARYAAQGTHQGSFMGIAATGKRVTFAGIDIVRVSGGKIVEHWEIFDQIGMMQQLGVIPPLGQG
jgi:predicted ester cyclase